MADNSASVAAAPAAPVAGPKEGILGLLSVYYDPQGTARRVQMRWFWIYPLIVISVVLAVVQLQIIPYMMPALRASMAERASGEQLESMVSFTHTIMLVSAYFMPLIIAIFAAIGALLMMGVGAVVDVRVRFQTLFSLSAVAGMITLLQQVANYFVVRAKGVDEVQTMRDVIAPFGLDIFINAQGVAGNVLAFFSIFQIWQIVMVALTYSHVAKVSKGKAFLITAPGWILALIVTMFRRT